MHKHMRRDGSPDLANRGRRGFLAKAGLLPILAAFSDGSRAVASAGETSYTRHPTGRRSPRYKGSRERCTHGYCISRTPSSIPGINIVAFAVAEYEETLCLSDYIFVRVSAISHLLQASLSFFLVFHHGCHVCTTTHPHHCCGHGRGRHCPLHVAPSTSAPRFSIQRT